MQVMINTEFIKLDQLIKLSGMVQTGGFAKQYYCRWYGKIKR